jgi:hypothetical protein
MSTRVTQSWVCDFCKQESDAVTTEFYSRTGHQLAERYRTMLSYNALDICMPCAQPIIEAFEKRQEEIYQARKLQNAYGDVKQRTVLLNASNKSEETK